MRIKSIPSLFLVITALLWSGGCAAQTDQQKLDSARLAFSHSRNIVTLLIATGDIAKNDPALREAIFKTGDQIAAAFDQAQVQLNLGNKVDFQFWFNQGMAALETFLVYEVRGAKARKAREPALSTS